MLCHLTALSLYIGIPFGNIIGPLVVWLLKKDDIGFVDSQGRESLNFQICMTIYALIAWLLTALFIGYILLVVLAIANIVLVIIASVTAYKGRGYRYPFIYRFL